jgi:hypothetical protein
MSSKLTDAETKYVVNVLMMACHSTPLEPQTTLVGAYLKDTVIHLLENWDEVRKNIAKEFTYGQGATTSSQNSCNR